MQIPIRHRDGVGVKAELGLITGFAIGAVVGDIDGNRIINQRVQAKAADQGGAGAYTQIAAINDAGRPGVEVARFKAIGKDQGAASRRGRCWRQGSGGGGGDSRSISGNGGGRGDNRRAGNAVEGEGGGRRVRRAETGLEAKGQGGAIGDRTVPSGVGDTDTCASLRQHAIPQIGDLLVTGKGPGNVPAIHGRARLVDDKEIHGKAIVPLAGILIGGDTRSGGPGGRAGRRRCHRRRAGDGRGCRRRGQCWGAGRCAGRTGRW